VYKRQILYVPFTLKWESSRFQLRATVPYIRIDGPGSVLGGPEGGIVIGPATGPAVTESGIGDVIVAATYNLYPGTGTDRPFVELTAKAKMPTADETRGLGTGEADYTIQADIFRVFGNVTPFAMIGYRFRGDPTGLPLEDGIVTSGGLSIKVSDSVSFGASYDYREAATLLGNSVSELSPFVTVKAGTNWSLNAYGVLGFTDGSPNSGGGLQIGRTFWWKR
jgi:hypothetical protein